MIAITDIKFPKFIEWDDVPRGSSLYADMMRNRVELYGSTTGSIKEAAYELLSDIHDSCQEGCIDSFSFEKEAYIEENNGTFKITIFFADTGDMANFAKSKLVTVRLVA